MRFYYYYLLLTFILLSAGCSSGSKAPEGIIPDTTMSTLVLEFTLIDAAYNTSLTDPSAVKFKPELFYENVLKEKGYSREQFIRSMHYYTQHTNELIGIYNAALEKLSEQQAQLNS